MPSLQTIDIDTMPAGREIDALVAALLGVDIPTPELAKAQVGMSYVVSTGPVFKLKDGRSVSMPEGSTLPDVPGTNHWNARYGIVVADFLGDEIRDEIAAYRLPPKPYSTSMDAAWEVVEKLKHLGFTLGFLSNEDERLQWDVSFGPNGRSEKNCVYEDTAPLAICRAALKAKEHT